MSNLNKKSINLICSIGNMNLSRKAVKSLEIERNFSDVSNKFSMTLIDTPQTQLTDLELYMCAGNRTISISYNDNSDESNYNPDKSGFVSFTGQIWDYTSNFVGNIKQLTISGYVSRKIHADTSGTALYNIDWNNYFCMRVDATKWWNVNGMVYKSNQAYHTWEYWNTKQAKADKANVTDLSLWTARDSNVVSFPNFAEHYHDNAVTIKIQGPGGSINLPIPDSFAQMVLDQNTEEGGNRYKGDNVDEDNRLWGPLTKIWSDPYYSNVTEEEPSDPSGYDVFWKDKSGNLRAFKLVGQTAYIQLNPSKDYYGSGSFLQSDLGVDPSYIVKQLCKLEGWKYTDASIVQTEMVPNSDSFKMNGQSALAFISEVLAPISITPAGMYTDSSGKKVKQKSGATGFHAWFDENDIFHYEPLTNLYRKDNTNILMGYNIPNSPVISFQVDTKGTAFYTSNAQEINSIYITTGKQVTSIETTASQSVDEYNKVSGHNEVMDNFFGYTYEKIQSMYEKQDNTPTNQFYAGFGTSGFSVNTNNPTMSPISLASGISVSSDGSIKELDKVSGQYYTIISSAVQQNLVTRLNSSAVANSTSLSAQLQSARDKISQFMITATLNIWGDTRLYPASLIKLTNMVKSTDSNNVQVHPTTGKYLILKQVDKISTDSYTQTLSLIRCNSELSNNVNPQKIDYSKGVSIIGEKTKEQAKFEKKVKESVDAMVAQEKANQTKVDEILSLWEEYLDGLQRKLIMKTYWKTRPKIYQDIFILRYPIVNSKFGPDSNGRYTITSHTGLIANKTITPERSWYSADLSIGVDGFIKLSEVQIDPGVYTWYCRAKHYKKIGQLGQKLLHDPQSINYKFTSDIIEYDTTSQWDENGDAKAGSSSKATTSNTNTFNPSGSLPPLNYNTKFQTNNNYFDITKNQYANFNKK